MSTLIKNAEIMTMSSEFGTVKGSIFIENGKIAKIIQNEVPGFHSDEVIDAQSQLVIPGMTNAHYHSYSNLLKGTENGFPLEIWSLYTVAYGHSLTDEDIYLSVLLGAAEMIRSGVTGCIDHFPHLPRIEAALKAYDESGMHVSFAPMMHDVPDHQFLGVPLPDFLIKKLEAKAPISVEKMRDLYEEIILRWHGKNGRIHIILGPNAPQRCSREMLALCKDLSVQYDLKVHTHLLETKIQEEIGRNTFENGIIGLLDEVGLLNDKLSVAHAVWLYDREIELLKERNVAFVHNPASNFILGSGRAPVSTYVKNHMPVGLGTDSSNCGTSHNQFETMRLASMMQRMSNPDYTEWLTNESIFKSATVTGAEIMEYSNKRGKIEVGYDADLVFLNKNTSTWAATNDAISQLVFHENGLSIDSVMIKGNWVLQKGKILSFDEHSVIARVQQRMKQVMENTSDALEFAEELKPYFEKFYHDFYK